jgi:kanamycin kinase
MGLAGRGDKHIDIFWVLWSLWFNLKTDRYTDCFLDYYGRDNIDLQIVKKLAYMEGKI